MSNTIPLPPLPEPVTLYHRPSFLAGEYIYITGYTPDQMREYAAAVSVADNAALLKLNASQSVHIISQSDRIKVLEDALRGVMSGCKYSCIAGEWHWHEKSIATNAALDAARAALGDSAPTTPPPSPSPRS